MSNKACKIKGLEGEIRRYTYWKVGEKVVDCEVINTNQKDA